MNGITYYRLKSDYPSDYTKNCALNGTEVDNNFYVLEGRDIKSIAVTDKDIRLTLMNGDTLAATGVLDFASRETVDGAIVNAEFDKVNGVLKLTTVNGETQMIEGFASNENTDFSVSTDDTLKGEGLRKSPLGIAPLAKTGTYKPVKAIINVNCNDKLPAQNLVGDRYVTVEDISDYGYLYDYRAVRAIACELKNTGWRIPTKEDWDDLLNAVEPCEGDKNHGRGDKNALLGKFAGKLLKSKTMWRDGDSCQCDEMPPHHGPHDHHHFHPHHHHHFHPHHHHHCTEDKFDFDYHHHHDNEHHCECDTTVCGCTTNENDVCFDYSDNPCVGTKECGFEKKCDWNKDYQGLDMFGMKITPAGHADENCRYGYFGERATFWTATTNSDNSKAYIKRFFYNKDNVYQDVVPTNYHYSLRLVKDYDGKNYCDTERILDAEYPTLLLPSQTNGKAIWTAVNVAISNPSLHPVLPNNGCGLSFTRHYFINEWDGCKWIRNEIKQGESVVVEKAPKDKWFIEYRVVGNDFLSVNGMVYREVIKDVAIEVSKEHWHAIHEEAHRREDEDRKIWNALNQEISDRGNSIEQEAATREEIDNQQWEAINTEVATREAEDQKIYAALAQETTDRTTVDNEQWESINNEIAARESEDNRISAALEQETNDRVSVDNQQWEAINTEVATRETEDQKISAALEQETTDRIEVDNQQWEAINTEREERQTKDTEIEGKLLSSEGTEFDSKTGVLTLKSQEGTNDVSVQFTFNFGTF